MKLFRKFWPLIFILAIWLILFSAFFLKGLLPIPADIITGVYYPWLDYKWGFSVGVPVKNPLLSDIPSLLYPWRSFAIDQLRNLKFPLWNPYYFAGMPLLANFQSAVFSYVNLLFLFLPKALAWSLGVMLSPLLTMMAMYIFLRHKKLGKIPGLLGSLVFSLSGFEIAWLEYNVHGHTALFLPLLLLAIDKIMEGRNRLWLFLLPLLVAFQIFAGYIPVVIYSYLVCIFYVCYFYLFPQFKKRQINWKKFFSLFLFWAWGLGLASIQIFPGYELIKNSIRLIDPIVLASEASYLPLKNLVTFIAPDFFGNPATGNYFGKAFYDNFYFFAGTGTLILVIFSLFYLKKEKNIFFWWLMLLFSFTLIFRNPVGVFLEKLLFLSGGVAARALFIADFSLAMLAGWGMEKFLANDKKARWKIIVSIVMVSIFFIFAAKVASQIESPINRLVAQRNLVIPFFFMIVCVFTLAVGQMTRFDLAIPGGLVFLILVSVQLLYSAKKYLPFSKRELLFPTTPVIEFLKSEQKKTKEPFRVELGEVIPQNFLMPYRIETISGSDALLPKKMGEFLSLVETGKVQERISRVHLLRNYNSPLFSLLNVKYILAKKTDEKGYFSPAGKPPSTFLNPRYKLVFEDKTVQVYEDSKFLPRAFWVHDDEADILKIIPPKISKNDKIDWLVYESDKIILKIESKEPGFIFLANNFFPGWKAFVNDKVTTIDQIEYSFSAVKVPSGRSLLTFEYKPKSFLYGSMISLLALLNFLMFSFVLLVKNLWERFN